MKFNYANALAISLLLAPVAADQPVHCLREQIFGVWNFKVHKET